MVVFMDVCVSERRTRSTNYISNNGQVMNHE